METSETTSTKQESATQAKQEKVVDFRIYKKDNNLDQEDNLDDIPTGAAVYAICARINNKPTNCRLVAETENLQEAVKKHFSLEENSECLRQFMQSIKIKTMDFLLLSDSTPETRNKLVEDWKKQYQPECNEKLNEIH